jgi:hypothetical protein
MCRAGREPHGDVRNLRGRGEGQRHANVCVAGHILGSMPFMVPSCALRSVPNVSVQPDLRRSPQGLAQVRAAQGGVAASAPTLTQASRPVWPALRGWSLRHSVVLAVAATLGVHLLSLTRQLGPDEGGFAMVARYAGTSGAYLYGPQWVDRPPGLIGLFAVADHLGPYGVRFTAALLAVGLVAAVAWAAEAVGGRSAARWAAWTGFAFASSVLLQAQRLNGELAAAAFVAVSIAALLRALLASTTRTQTVVLGLLAGVSGMLAVLMKQSFVDAFVFAGVLLLAGIGTSANRLTYSPARVLATLGAFAAGAAVPAAATLWWAQSHGGARVLLYAVVGFRADAAAVMAHWSLAAPLHRAGALAVVAWLTGLLFLVGHLAFVHRRRLRRLDPLPWALAATVTVELVGVVAGGNFWDHYLIALIPTVAVAAGLSVNRRVPGAAWTRRLVVLAGAVTALTSPITAVNAADSTSAAYTTGRWVAASAQADDTLVVPFTHANVIDAAGLRPGYPYAWSLPTRTLDPHLDLLTSSLAGPEAPTWVVRWDASDSWGLDPAHRVDAALHAHYRPVGQICGHAVWLHDGAIRALAPTPPTSACGPGDQ